MTTPLDLAGGVVGLGTAIAKAADRPDDVDRAEWVGRVRGHVARCVEGYRRARHPGRRRRYAVAGARFAGALRDYERQHGYASTLPTLPWEAP